MNFNQLNGSAKKSEVTYMKLVDGPNVFRILPDSVLPGYTYWVKGKNGKDLPFDSLQFDAKTERFNNNIACPVRDLGIKDAEGKDLRCNWAYKCLVINQATGKIETLGLKKGMLQEMISVATDMGIDPTDVDTGTWFTVKREKTGSMAFNVKYTVAQMKCKSEPLSDEHKEMIEKQKTIKELFPKESYEDQLKRLKKHVEGEAEETSTGPSVDSEAVSELG